MVGKGALIECIESPLVKRVDVIVRKHLSIKHEKIREHIHQNFLDFDSLKESFTDIDACFYCVGISSLGLSESQYREITLDYTVAAANLLVKQSPNCVFCFVSGTGTDSSAKGKVMWARVKGEAENHLLSLPFKAAYMLRPGFIQPMKGVQSKTRLYRFFYVLLAPLFPIIKMLARPYITTTEAMGKAMIQLTLKGYPKPWLSTRDINKAAEVA